MRQPGEILRAQEHAVVSEGVKIDPGCAGQVHTHAGENVVVERNAMMVPDTGLLPRRPPGYERFSLRPKKVGTRNSLTAEIGAVHKSSLRNKSRTVIGVIGLQVKFSAGAVEDSFVCRAAGMRPVQVKR